MDAAALDAYLAGLADADLFSGTVIITRDRRELFSGAYGWASRTWGVPADLGTRFDTASITKLFTVVVALQAVGDGAISLDTPAVEYLGLEDTAMSPHATLHHLLTHTSGLGDDAEEEDGEDYAEVWKTRISYMVRETRDLFPQFVHKPPNFEPGGGCRYCNAGFILAGAMVEEARGRPFRDLVQEGVFDPAGMSDSGFFSMDVIEPRVAEGADPRGDEWVRNIYSYPPIGSPDGGAHSTVGDLHRFLVAAQDGVLLEEAETHLLFTPQVLHSHDGPKRLEYGFGFEFTYEHDELIYYEKEGVNAGTSGFLRHYPGSRITVAMLSNLANGVWGPRRHIHDLLGTRLHNDPHKGLT